MATLAQVELGYLTPPKEELPAFYCDICGEGMYYDDTYYPIGGLRYCESCMVEIRCMVNESDYPARISH